MAMMRVADEGGADQGEQKVRTNNRPRRIIVNVHGLRPRRSHALAGDEQKDPRWRFVQLPPHHPPLRFSGTLAHPQTAEENRRTGRRLQTGSLYFAHARIGSRRRILDFASIVVLKAAQVRVLIDLWPVVSTSCRIRKAIRATKEWQI